MLSWLSHYGNSYKFDSSNIYVFTHYVFKFRAWNLFEFIGIKIINNFVYLMGLTESQQYIESGDIFQRVLKNQGSLIIWLFLDNNKNVFLVCI